MPTESEFFESTLGNLTSTNNFVDLKKKKKNYLKQFWQRQKNHEERNTIKGKIWDT